MNQRTQVPARTERLRTVSVPKAVAAFLVAGLFVLTAVGIVLALALRQTATAEAIRVARLVTSLEATSVVGQVLVDEALVPGPAYDKLDQVVRQHVISSQIVRIKVWDATGRIVYSDDRSLVGKRFPLGADDLTALKRGGAFADVTDLTASENMGEKKFGKLLQVYLGVKTPTGQRLLFETYQPYQTISDASRRTWLASLPVLLGGLLLLYLVQAPLAYRMARRLKRSQDEREAMLLASLAASDRERHLLNLPACAQHHRQPVGATRVPNRLPSPVHRPGRSHRQPASGRPDPPGSDRPSIPCNSRALRGINPAVHT